MKIKEFIVILVFSISVFFTGWVVKGELYPTKPKEIIRTDSVFVNVPYEVEIIKEIQKPIVVTEYVTKYDSIEVIRVVKDTIYITIPDGTLTYHSKFLTNYPKAPKFLGLHQENGYIVFTGLTISGNTIAKKYTVGYNNYRLGLDGDEFVGIDTYPRKKDLFSHYIGAGWSQRWDKGAPYVKWEPRFTFNELSIGASFYLKQEPEIQLGLNYEL